MRIILCLAVLALLPPLPAQDPSRNIPVDMLGAEAQKRYAGDGISITPTADGARLRSILQRLEGNATTTGLWLSSTAEEDVVKPNQFCVMAASVGRGHEMHCLNSAGVVSVMPESAAWTRPGLVEEYRVCSDGVRQDFVLPQRPPGTGGLAVDLQVTGASALEAAYGVKLTLDTTGRELAYHRLQVTDARGRALAARLEVLAADRVRVLVDDANATYPVRIDPTFTDADWISLETGVLGANGSVECLAMDGNGHLYIGGSFSAVGFTLVSNVAKWNGSAWSALGSGTNEAVSDLEIVGGELYAGGGFTTAGGVEVNRIAKWNGSAWSGLGLGMDSYVGELLAVGSDLYASGSFLTAGGVAANRIAKWNGSTWSALGSGLSSGARLAVMGGQIYAGGSITTAGGVAVNRIARWDGGSWFALGTGTNSFINAMVVHGGELYVGGNFSAAGGVIANRMAKWNGSSWSAAGTGFTESVQDMVVFNGSVYAAGMFLKFGHTPYSHLWRLNGSAWSNLGIELDGQISGLLAAGTDLHTVGYFKHVGTTSVNRIAKWDGSTWSALGNGTDHGVKAIALAGNDLYIGGNFTRVGTTMANRVAKWNGSTWSALGSGVNDRLQSMTVMGGDLYVGGYFTTAGGSPASCIAKWNGSSWSALGSGTEGPVEAMVVMGGELYAGGSFIVAGGVSVVCLAKWNGSAWSALAGPALSGPVYSLLTDNAGHLYAGGDIGEAGEITVNSITRWDGSTWSALGSGVNGTVSTMVMMGGNLYAAGNFTLAGETEVNYVAKWDGSTWSALGSGMDQQVKALAVSGGELYAGGWFATAGGMPARFLAKWDGTAWSALGSAVDNIVEAMVTDNTGHLYIGGDFCFAGSTLSPSIVKASLQPIRPDIAVTQISPLADGGSVTFATVVAGSSGAARSFTITNTGAADLSDLAVTKDGDDSAHFSVSELSATNIPTGPGTATFTVTFSPTSSGSKTAALHITSNVTGSKNPYDITLSGTAQSVYEAWAMSNGLSTDPDVLNGRNLRAFAFGHPPAARPELRYVGTLAGGGSLATPGIPVTKVEGSEFRALFVRRKDHGVAGLIYAPRFSANLTIWHDSAVAPVVLADDGLYEVVSVPYPALVGGEPARFFQLTLTLAP